MARTAQTIKRTFAPPWSAMLLGLCCCLGWTALCPHHAAAQSEVKIWEFSPYEVEILYLFDSSLDASATAQQVWLSQVEADLERTFRAAWNIRMTPLRGPLAPRLLRHFESFTIADLKPQERLPLEVAASDTLSTEQGAMSLVDTAPAPPPASPPADRKALEKKNRTDELWRDRDKLFFLLVRQLGEETVVEVRELDGPLQFLGPAVRDRTFDWNYSSRLAATNIVRAFAPVARVEEAESRSAQLRLRAGGLIVQSDNPANVVVGDVLQPVVRRDDRNGVPTLLEPLPWTFAAVTASDGIKLAANVYTYSGGPGLQGRKNRRTQRVVLKVRPLYEQTDLELVLRTEGQPQAGCFIYSRDLITDQFDLIGRTDWRGRLTIHPPLQQSAILPEAIRALRAKEKREALAAAAAAAEKASAAAASKSSAKSEVVATDQPESDPTSVGNEATPDSPPASNAQSSPPSSVASTVENSTPDPSSISLQVPLLQLYVKQGDAVLAKLPMVPGLAPVETAELPDDRRRLLAEAFVRGFQGEILDVVGMRNLLAARVKHQVAKDQLDAAKQTVDELRRLKNYTQMADELEVIQRRMLDETEGPIPLAAKNRIDGLFQTTRTMLQKYLQDSLLTDSERAIAAK